MWSLLASFDGGTFELELFLPKEHPMTAHKIHFIIKMYYPNIERDTPGRCL
jgi:ubiquitin-protein ligase